MLNLFGLTSCGIFSGGKFKGFDTINLPSWNKFYVYDMERKEVELPGVGNTMCRVYKYNKGHKFCISNVLEDALNAQFYLNNVTYGKLPGTIPYDKVLFTWFKNQIMNHVDFGVPSLILEVILRCSYRYAKDPSKNFASIIGKAKEGITMYDYIMASIRRICQLTSTFTGITFEDFDSMVSTAINRSKNKSGPEPYSPLEELFKL